MFQQGFDALYFGSLDEAATVRGAHSAKFRGEPLTVFVRHPVPLMYFDTTGTTLLQFQSNWATAIFKSGH